MSHRASVPRARASVRASRPRSCRIGYAARPMPSHRTPRPLRRALSLVVLCASAACAGPEPTTSTTTGAGTTSAATPPTGATAATGAAAEPVPSAGSNGDEWGRAPLTPDPSARLEDGFFVADGAPSPMACVTDADCQGNTLPAVGGCCQDPTSLGVYSSAYREWLGRWRTAHCGGVECPTPPSPARPADCYFDVHCAAGGCANTCRF